MSQRYEHNSDQPMSHDRRSEQRQYRGGQEPRYGDRDYSRGASYAARERESLAGDRRSSYSAGRVERERLDRMDDGRSSYSRDRSTRERRSRSDDYRSSYSERPSDRAQRPQAGDYQNPYSRTRVEREHQQGVRSRQHADFDQRYTSRSPQRGAGARHPQQDAAARNLQRGAAARNMQHDTAMRQRMAYEQRYASRLDGRTRTGERPPQIEPRLMSNASRLQDGSGRGRQSYPVLGQAQRGPSRLPFIAGIAAVAIVVAIVMVVFHPFNSKITLNGVEQAVARDATIATLLDEGLATPKAGNLLAIDGSVFTEGGGDAFAATVNGEATTDPQTLVPNGAEVEIKDGADVTETFKSSEETIKHGVADSSTSAESYWSGSLHVYSKGTDGVKTVKTGDVSGKKIEEITKPAVDSGYSNYTASVGDDKVVALTFDDGPWPDTTKELLDIFESNKAKCTFFTIGNQISTYADQVKRAHELGCQVCTHTWDHAAGSGEGVNLTFMSEEEQISEVKKGYKAIKEAIGTEPDHVMRAPGGNYFGDLITTLAPYVDAEIGWDVDTEDWRTPGADKIYKRIMSVKPGQVVLMHDGGGNRSQTVEAVSKAVPDLMAQGYKLVTVNELLAYGTPQKKSEAS